MKLLIQAFVVLVCVQAFGQSKTDSLLLALETAEGELKVKTFNELFKANVNSNPVEAVNYARQALALATEINDQKGMAAANNNLGVSYRNQGALEKSLAYYFNALKTYESIDNKEGIASTKNNIGTIYAFKKDYEKAIQYFQESHKLFQEMGDSVKVIGSMNNLGNLNNDLEMYDEALKYYTEAFEMSQRLGRQYADPVSNIGNIFLKKGDYETAAKYYVKALELSRKENDQIEQLNIYASLGEVLSLAGRHSLAQNYLDTAFAMSNQLQAYVYQPTILKSMANNYSKQGKMKEAFNAMVKYDQSREQIYSEESNRKIAQMEMALDLQEKEKELDSVKAEKQIQSLELKNARMVITIAVLVIGVVIGGFNLFYTKRQAAQLKKKALKQR